MANPSKLFDGSVAIPVAFLAELDWRDGDQIVWTASRLLKYRAPARVS